MEVPELLSEILLLIMDVLAARRWRLTLLRFCLADHATYAMGLPALLRRLDVHAGNCRKVLDRFALRLRQVGTANKKKLVSAVAVRLAGIADRDAVQLAVTFAASLVLHSIEIDVAGTVGRSTANSFFSCSLETRPLSEAVVTGAEAAHVTSLLEELGLWRGTGRLAIYPANARALGGRAFVEGPLLFPVMFGGRRGNWKAEIRGLVDCSADGGWTLEQQREHWAAYGYGASVVP
ncbi:hypothetical protein DFJ74DRAFT_691224 [Hyaloraphidium curvatum]|nr:hypothetical protein DFJ74DRAFT_691224 [Hyaloraphidium curvatum]